MKKTETIFYGTKRKVLLLFCVLAALVVIFPFSIKNTYAAKTRYAYASITINGSTSTIGVRYGDNPGIWVVKDTNHHNITITGKNNATTSGSSGISPKGKLNNWNYASLKIDIPEGWYFPAGTSWSNFESGSSAIQFTTPGGVTSPSTNSGLPTYYTGYARTWYCTVYWLNTATSPSTNGNQSYKYWNFTRPSFTVIFRNASNGEHARYSVAYGDNAPNPGNPGRTGYTFAGWNQVYTSVKSDLDISPTWTANTYTVQYNGNGNTGGSTGNSTHTYDTAKNLTTNGFTKTGYSFAGWATSAGGSVVYSNGQSVKNIATGGTITLYAKWTANSYYLDVNGRLDGSNVGNTSGYGTFDVYVNNQLVANDVTDFYQKITYGSTYSITDIRSTTGHTYEGVYSGDVSGTMGAGDRSVYLQFSTNKYTYTFVYGNGSSNSTGTKTYGVPYKLPSTPTRTGYKFLNWKSGTSNATYAAGASCSEEGNRTFTAQWQALDYYIRYNGNGAEKGSMDTVKATVSVEKTLDLCKFGRAGYTFLGWSKSANATTATYTDEAKVKDLTTTGNATVDLYAVWKKEASPEINMFTGCFKVSGEAGTKYDRRYVNHKRANIDKSGDPGYFTRK